MPNKSSEQDLMQETVEEKREISPEWVRTILEKNSNLNFVQRILHPENFPKIKNEDGSVSTHLMSWTTIGEGRIPIVYPNIVMKGDQLELLSPEEAVRHAVGSGEYISFGNEREADLFSKEYKVIHNPPKKDEQKDLMEETINAR